MGRHLRAAGLGPPERHDPLGRAGRHRPSGLRERVGPLRTARGGAARRRPRAGGGGRPAGRPSADPPRPSWSRRCAIPRGRRDGARARAARASRPGSPATRSASSSASYAWARPSRPRTPTAWPPSASPTTRRWPRPSAPATSTATGGRWPPRWPRRPATSCWWRTPPTCRRPARRRAPAGRPAVERDRAGVGRLSLPGPDALEDGAGSSPQASMKNQAWWKAVTADDPVAGAEDGHQAGHPERDADLAAHGVEGGAGGEALRRQRGGGRAAERRQHQPDAEAARRGCPGR